MPTCLDESALQVAEVIDNNCSNCQSVSGLRSPDCHPEPTWRAPHGVAKHSLECNQGCSS